MYIYFLRTEQLAELCRDVILVEDKDVLELYEWIRVRYQDNLLRIQD